MKKRIRGHFERIDIKPMGTCNEAGGMRCTGSLSKLAVGLPWNETVLRIH